MDKKIKSIQKTTKLLEKKEANLLKLDKKHDKLIDRAKKAEIKLPKKQKRKK